MDTTTKAALENLLQIQALSEVSPARVQIWQQAARILLGVDEGAGEGAGPDDTEVAEPTLAVKPARAKHSGSAPTD